VLLAEFVVTGLHLVEDAFENGLLYLQRHRALVSLVISLDRRVDDMLRDPGSLTGLD
jgi:hypothetical protein